MYFAKLFTKIRILMCKIGSKMKKIIYQTLYNKIVYKIYTIIRDYQYLCIESMSLVPITTNQIFFDKKMENLS